MLALARIRSLILCLVISINCFSQSSTILTTFAGPPLPANGVPAVTQAIGDAYSVLCDGPGRFYFASGEHHRVYRVTIGTLTVVAGTGRAGFSGDSGPAKAAELNNPVGLALDAAGNLFIADAGNHRIRKVNIDGVITTVAGTQDKGFSGDGGPAIAAQLNTPLDIAVDNAGNLIIADSQNNRIRKVNPAGVISTMAGTGIEGFSGDGGPALTAQFANPVAVALSTSGNLFVTDSHNQRIRKIDVAGIIRTVAGNGTAGPGGDGGSALAAQLNYPLGITLDPADNLFVADYWNNRVRRVNTAGIITTVAGTGILGFSGDGGPATAAQLSAATDVALDPEGNLFISELPSDRIRRVTPNGVIQTVAGNGTRGFIGSGDGGPATSARFDNPVAVTTDAAGNLYVADSGDGRVRAISPDGVIRTAAGTSARASGNGDGSPAISATLGNPIAVAVGTDGSLFIADGLMADVRKVNPTGIISTVAGAFPPGFSGDGGPATQAQLHNPSGLAVDANGNLFIADSSNNRIRKVTADGVINTIAGIGTAGFSGDGGAALSAQLSGPVGIVVAPDGSLLIADTGNHRIRKISPAGVITTIAGTETRGFGGDGGSATAAQLDSPSGVVLDAYGNLYIADTGNNRIRKISTTGVITTVAGTGTRGFSGDGGPPAAAELNRPRGVAIDGAGNVYIADSENYRIRKVITVSPVVSFAIGNRGGMSTQTTGPFPVITVGYAGIYPDSGSPAPSGMAIFGFRQNGVLVTEAAVPASSLIRSGRIYAEVNGPVNTGLAIANPNNQVATVSFFFTNESGDFGHGNLTIPTNGQTAAFLDRFSNAASSFSGAFSFSSSLPIGVIALHGLTNERGEFLITTLPVTDLGVANASSPAILPHFADGGGWFTDIILLNTTDGVLTGTAQFRNSSGEPETLVIDGQSGSGFAYSIAPHGSRKVRTSGSGASIRSGSVWITPASGMVAPAPLAIFSFRTGGITVAQAGVPAVPAASAFRLYAELSGSIQTGIAIANAAGSQATVLVEAYNLNGSPAGPRGTVMVPANGQTALFLSQIDELRSLEPFQGVLRISSNEPVSILGLRGRYNERGDFLITTTTPVNESAPPSNSPLFIPHVVDSGGYTTQFVLFSGSAGQTAFGALKFFSQSGNALNLSFR